MPEPIMPNPINPIFISPSRCCSPAPRLPLVEHVLGHLCGGHRRRPAGVKGEMGDDLAELFLAEAVVERPPEMTDELPFATERDQGGTGDQAAVALGETGTFPDLAEQNPFAEIDQAWNDVADLLASGRRLRLSHGFLLFRSSGWIRCDRSTRLRRRASGNDPASPRRCLSCGGAHRVLLGSILFCRRLRL